MLDHDIQHNQPRRESLQRDIDAYLDSGKMIEVLTTTPDSTENKPKYHNYFNTRAK